MRIRKYVSFVILAIFIIIMGDAMYAFMTWGRINSFYIENVDKPQQLELVYTAGNLYLDYTIDGWVSDSASISVRNESGANFGYWIVKDSVHIKQNLSDYYYGVTPILIKYEPIAAKRGQLEIKMKAVPF